MSLALTEWWRLRRIGKAVGRTDPGLAAKLAIFSKLAAGDPMPAHEQLRLLSSPGQAPLTQRHQRASL